jgi:hypothetical protein
MIVVPLSGVVRLSSERARKAVRQDCSLAKKQESPAALLVVVPSSQVVVRDGGDCSRGGSRRHIPAS